MTSITPNGKFPPAKNTNTTAHRTVPNFPTLENPRVNFSFPECFDVQRDSPADIAFACTIIGSFFNGIPPGFTTAPKVNNTAELVKDIRNDTIDRKALEAACGFAAHCNPFLPLETRVELEKKLLAVVECIKNASKTFIALVNSYPTKLISPHLLPTATSNNPCSSLTKASFSAVNPVPQCVLHSEEKTGSVANVWTELQKKVQKPTEKTIASSRPCKNENQTVNFGLYDTDDGLLCYAIAMSFHQLQPRVPHLKTEKLVDFSHFIKTIQNGTINYSLVAAACTSFANSNPFHLLQSRIDSEKNLQSLITKVIEKSLDLTAFSYRYPGFMKPFVPPAAATIKTTSQSSQQTANVASVSEQSTSAAVDAKEKIMANSNASKKKNKNKNNKPSQEEVLEAQLKNLQLGKAQVALKQEKQPDMKQKKKNEEKQKNPFTPSIAQKVSSNCEKCARTSKRCNDANTELKSARNENETLKKSLAKYEGPKEQPNGKKSWFELEKELREEKQKNEEMRVEKEKSAEKEKEMEKELERAHSKISELTTQNAEKDESIRLLKSNVEPDVLKHISKNHRWSQDMRKTFWELRGKQDTWLAEDPLGRAAETVNSLKKVCEDPEIQQRADHELRKFKQDLDHHTAAVEQEIKKMQSDSFITRAELSAIPELPVLPPGLYKALEEAQAKRNEKIDKACVICFLREGEHWFSCPKCPKKTHSECARRWWASEQKQKKQKSCPHCRLIL